MKRPRRGGRGICVTFLWVAAIYALFGVGAYRLWNLFDPPPKDGERIVAGLEEYKAAHGQYPATLSEADLPGTLPGMARVIYSLGEGSGGEFELQLWRDENGDESWTYKSQNRRWRHFRLSDGGGLSDFGGG